MRRGPYLWLLLTAAAATTQSSSSPLRVGRYQETRVSEPDPNVLWQSWAPAPPNKVRSPTSNEDDGPFDPMDTPFCFPFFTMQGAAVSISPNGFLSLQPAPLCQLASPSGLTLSDVFCSSNQTGYYKIIETPAGYVGGDYPLIGVMVEDLNPSMSSAAGIYYWTTQKYTPSQTVLVVEYDNVPIFGTLNQQFTMQVELMSNGTIVFRYQQLKSPLFIGQTGSPPFVGLVWSRLQRRILAYPATAHTVIRLDYVVDACTSATSCATCINSTATGWSEALDSPVTVRCHWCANLNLCIGADLVADFCSNADLFESACSLGAVHGYRYSQQITYGPPASFLDASTLPQTPAPTDSLPFFTNPPSGSEGAAPTAVGISTYGFLSFGLGAASLLGDCPIPFPGSLSSPLCLPSTASPFRAFLEPGTSIFDDWVQPVANDPNSTQLLIQWTNGYLAASVADKFTFQIALFPNGRIEMRYGTASAVTSTCPDPVIWTAYPTPFVGLTPDSSTVAGSVVPWQLLRTGAVVAFEPIVGCGVQCAFEGCNHTSLSCVCYCRNGTCGDANVSNGTCVACDPGWAGDLCDIPCTCNPQQGNCSEGPQGNGHCAAACEGAGFMGPDCDVCAPHFYGPNCQSCPCDSHVFCFDGLRGNGTCAGCNHGWAGPNCSICPRGFYGPNCFPCACSQGRCDGGPSGTGVCQSCFVGWAGPSCNISCNCSAPNMNCFDGTLGTGQCYCSLGWSLAAGCADCDGTHYGPHCAACPCLNGQCDSGVNGSGVCVSCDVGFYGQYCESSSQASSGLMGVIIIIVIFVLMLLCGCIIVILFLLLRHKRSPIAAMIVERRPGGDREVIPIMRVPIQGHPVQGIPLRQIPLGTVEATAPWDGGRPVPPAGSPGPPAADGPGTPPPLFPVPWQLEPPIADSQPILAQNNSHGLEFQD